MHSTNTKEFKFFCIPKVKKLNYDANMVVNDNLKHHINSGCSNLMNEDINIFFYFTPMRGENSSYDNIKCKSVGSETISKNPSHTFE